MSIQYLKCVARGCRQENNLVLCGACGRLACPSHSAIVGTGTLVCTACAPITATPRRQSSTAAQQQQELFT